MQNKILQQIPYLKAKTQSNRVDDCVSRYALKKKLIRFILIGTLQSDGISLEMRVKF